MAIEGASVVEIARELGHNHGTISRDLKAALEDAAAEDDAIDTARYRAQHVRRLEYLFRQAVKRSGSSVKWHERAGSILSQLARVRGLTSPEELRALAINAGGNIGEVTVQFVLPSGKTVADYPAEPPTVSVVQANGQDAGNGQDAPAAIVDSQPLALPAPVDSGPGEREAVAGVSEAQEIPLEADTAPGEAISQDSEGEALPDSVPASFRRVRIPTDRLPQQARG